MDYYVLFLRFVHVVAGIFWVGAALTISFFIGPTVRATGDAGQQVVRHLITRARFSTYVSIAAGLTLLAGAALYWRDSGGFDSAWARSGPGIGFGIGGVAGLIAGVLGGMIGRNFGALAKLGTEIHGQPSAEQAAKLGSVQKSQAILGPLLVIFLLASASLMALARYLVF